MSVMKRVTDILSANLNELIERYEDPELLLRQAVREMEEAIRGALTNASQVVAHEKILTRHLSEEEAAIERYQKAAETAAGLNDDHRALALLRQKREHRMAASSLAKQLAEVTEAAQVLRAQIESMRRRVENAKCKLTVLKARHRAAESRKRLLQPFSDRPLGDEPFCKFDRMCRKVEQVEAEADALAEWSQAFAGQSPCHSDPYGISEEDLQSELKQLKNKTPE